MTFLGKLISYFSSRDIHSAPESSASSLKPSSTSSGRLQPFETRTPSAATTTRTVSPEAQEEMARYQYVLVPCTRPLSEFRPWCAPLTSDISSQRRSADAHDWLKPFLSPSVFDRTALDSLLRNGVANAKAIPPALRSIIRAKRKAKEPHRELLQALYGSCVLVDFVDSLQAEYHVFYTNVAPFVDFEDLLRMRCNVTMMGYRRVRALKQTDIKWLVSEFGEPSVHLSYLPLWESLRRDAVRRYSRAEIIRNNSRVKSGKEVEEALPDWLRGRIEFSMRLRAEDRARAEATSVRNRQRETALECFEDVWKSTDHDFIVADLETTGLDPKACEILELAAVRLDSTGKILSEFSALVRIEGPVPVFITQLTGISQLDVDRDGLPRYDALSAFLSFVGNRPVFFHNAPFDVSFLEQATQQSGLRFPNLIHDTLPIARATWPEMRSHKLETLAKIVDAAPAPTHRALADAKTTLAVLLAAREAAGY